MQSPVVVATENIAHDIHTPLFHGLVCSDSPFGVEELGRLVSKVHRGGTVVHLLTRDDAITFQKAMESHGVSVDEFCAGD
jgi:hypothetical protein